MGATDGTRQPRELSSPGRTQSRGSSIILIGLDPERLFPTQSDRLPLGVEHHVDAVAVIISGGFWGKTEWSAENVARIRAAPTRGALATRLGKSAVSFGTPRDPLPEPCYSRLLALVAGCERLVRDRRDNPSGCSAPSRLALRWLADGRWSCRSPVRAGR